MRTKEIDLDYMCRGPVQGFKVSKIKLFINTSAYLLITSMYDI